MYFVCTPAYLLIIIIAGTLGNLFDLVFFCHSSLLLTNSTHFTKKLESRTRYLVLEINRVYTNFQRTTIRHPVIQSRDIKTRISALGVYYYSRDSLSICQHGIDINLIPGSAHRAPSTISKTSPRRAWLHSDKHDGFQSPIAGFWRSHIPPFFNIDNTIHYTPSQRVNATTARPVFAGINRVGQKLTTIEVWILVLWSSRHTLEPKNYAFARSRTSDIVFLFSGDILAPCQYHLSLSGIYLIHDIPPKAMHGHQKLTLSR